MLPIRQWNTAEIAAGTGAMAIIKASSRTLRMAHFKQPGPCAPI